MRKNHLIYIEPITLGDMSRQCSYSIHWKAAPWALIFPTYQRQAVSGPHRQAASGHLIGSVPLSYLEATCSQDAELGCRQR